MDGWMDDDHTHMGAAHLETLYTSHAHFAKKIPIIWVGKLDIVAHGHVP